MVDEVRKHLIRNVVESLVYSVRTNIPFSQAYNRYNVISDFLASLNRKGIIDNSEYESYMELAKEKLQKLMIIQRSDGLYVCECGETFDSFEEAMKHVKASH